MRDDFSVDILTVAEKPSNRYFTTFHRGARRADRSIVAIKIEKLDVEFLF